MVKLDGAMKVQVGDLVAWADGLPDPQEAELRTVMPLDKLKGDALCLLMEICQCDMGVVEEDEEDILGAPLFVQFVEF